jgi:hypothetical protein
VIADGNRIIISRIALRALLLAQARKAGLSSARLPHFPAARPCSRCRKMLSVFIGARLLAENRFPLFRKTL